MNLTDYHIFKAVVDAGSFANAAEILGKTPSGLSRRISRLEDRMGQRLITRTTRRLTLTDKGELFLIHCNKLVQEMAFAEAEIATPDTELTGILKIRIIATYASRGFIPILTGFQKTYPGIVPWIIPEGAADKEDTDIVISSVDTLAGHQGRLLLEPSSWVVCAAPCYLQRRGVPQTPEDLKQHDCLALDIAGKVRRRWRFQAQDNVFDVQVSPSQIGFGDTIHAAARNSQGIARLASFLVRQDIENGDLVPLLKEYSPTPERAICAVLSDNVAHLSKARAFLEYASQYSAQNTDINT